MSLNAVGIRVGKPQSVIDISDELLAEIITNKLSGGYDNLKRIIYETRPLETIKVVSKIDDYIKDSHTAAIESNTNHTNKSELAYKAQNSPYCSNGKHNPLTKHSIEECIQLKNKNKHKQKDKRQHYKKKKANLANKNQEPIFEESYSSTEKNPVVRYSKAFVKKCSPQSLKPYLDTAASSHMVGDKGAFLTYTRKDMSVETTNGLQTPSLGQGYVQFISNDRKATLHCLHVLDLAETLISMGKLWKSAFTILKTKDHLFSIERGNNTLIKGKVSNNLFILDMEL
ncbi:hypothetical protein O181_047502 [Austropuccinia psidii MF-1]|uniref:Retrovirus-related Pol polyprotein from transposon TNT 1-94-like beta-barrel domain-containing protein n=1 Tax=Austropuccinia psidii MF-1 TaxID=1389203 RepID=A0A9Q3DTA5_9BASI|nr:hypothetical protein [Austropuccinia psidii MF-1]